MFIEAVWLTTCPLISKIKLNQRVMQQRITLANVILNAKPTQTQNNKSPIETH
jgi:hypothetical protein